MKFTSSIVLAALLGSSTIAININQQQMMSKMAKEEPAADATVTATPAADATATPAATANTTTEAAAANTTTAANTTEEAAVPLTNAEKKAAIEARVEAAAEAAWVKKETEDKEVRTKFNAFRDEVALNMTKENSYRNGVMKKSDGSETVEPE
jgi:hypothetical protein